MFGIGDVMRRRAGLPVVTAACLLAIPVTTAHAAPKAPPTPKYQQSRQCIGAVPAVPNVSDGVSWAQQQLLYTSLWKYSTGAGVKVAVIDTGVNPGLELVICLSGAGELVAKVPGQPGLTDCDGHGTLVAGLIAAKADPRSGFSGVAPSATVMSIRQNSLAYRPTAGRSGEDSAGTSASLAQAVNMAVARGARVINISAAECGPAAAYTSPALRSSITNAVRRNVVVVVAAGNLGSTSACKEQNVPGSPLVTRVAPADVPAALTVGSVGRNGQPSTFSVAGPWVDVAAPGEQIISVNPHPRTRGEVDKVISSEGYSSIQGTSFSAPYVSGLAALIRAKYPRLTAQQVINRIRLTSGPAAGSGGTSYAVGAGQINPMQALTAVIPAEQQSTVPNQAAVTTVAAPSPTAVPPGREIALWSSLGIVGALAVGGLGRLIRRQQAVRQ